MRSTARCPRAARAYRRVMFRLEPNSSSTTRSSAYTACCARANCTRTHGSRSLAIIVFFCASLPSPVWRDRWSMH
jgi:hypothetical protein